ncbi:MAG: hypothetical protein WBM00_00060 [Solirubrobacterales bacterium]
MRLARRLPLPVVLAAILAAGCGSSSGDHSQTTTGTSPERISPTTGTSAPPGASTQSCGNTTVAGTSQLRVTGVGCPIGRGVVANWANDASCTADVSRPSCTIYHGYRCIGARTETGIAVSCTQPGRSIAFLAKRG